jgi:hypothetical protein
LFEDGHWYLMFATAFAEVNHNNHYLLRIKGLGVISKELFSDKALHDAQRFFRTMIWYQLHLLSVRYLTG